MIQIIAPWAAAFILLLALAGCVRSVHSADSTPDDITETTDEGVNK